MAGVDEEKAKAPEGDGLGRLEGLVDSIVESRTVTLPEWPDLKTCKKTYRDFQSCCSALHPKSSSRWPS